MPSHHKPSWAKWWRSYRWRSYYPCRGIIVILPRWSTCLGLESSDHVESDPIVPGHVSNLLTQPFNQTAHWNLSKLHLHAWFLKPQQSRNRVSLRQRQHEFRLLKEDQPDQPMRQSGPIFTKWCLSNQLDFRSPPLMSIADFLLYLFQDRKLQPSTINGYRSAIAQKLGNSPINVSKDENLTRLLDTFYRQTLDIEGHTLLNPLSGATPPDKGSI